jgi:HAD superfamily phosphatase (TIGR01668 family)
MGLAPDLYYRSIADIEPEYLVARGVRALLIDLDNTLVLRNTLDASPEVHAWLASALGVGLKACIVSNNWHERVMHAEDVFGIPVIGKSTKPLPGGFRRGLRVLEVRASEAAVIGDQVFTDVLGGARIGAMTILVQPLSGGSDLPHTVLLRAFERLVLRGRQPIVRSSGPSSDAVSDSAGETLDAEVR